MYSVKFNNCFFCGFRYAWEGLPQPQGRGTLTGGESSVAGRQKGVDRKAD